MNFRTKSCFLIIFTSSFLFCQSQNEPKAEKIFPMVNQHTHGSTIVELPNGDLLSAWFQGNGERWSDDVRIMGARLLKGNTEWGKPFVLADVPEFPDINPVLFLDTQKKLWLVWYTVIANQWETSLIKYRISENYLQQEGAPEWSWQDVLLVKPGDPTERGMLPNDRFVKSVKEQQNIFREYLKEQGASEKGLKHWDSFAEDIMGKARGDNMVRQGRIYAEDGSYEKKKLAYPYFRRMGWQTKNKPIFVGDRMILPLYSDGLEMSLFAITDDFGKNWIFSTPLVGAANIQASTAIKKDGTLVTYMRDNGPPPKRHPVSHSTDNGLTWSPVRDSKLMNPGSGSDVVTLKNGHWVIAYNDTEDGRYSLAVSLSQDEGETWAYKKLIELDLNPEKKLRATGAYPSIIQGTDEMIHVIYSYVEKAKNEKNSETIKHISFDENWIKSDKD